MKMIYNGFYGSNDTPCEIFYYNGWYCVEDSINVNFTHETLQDGVNVENITDSDCFTWDKPIKTIDELIEAVEA